MKQANHEAKQGILPQVTSKIIDSIKSAQLKESNQTLNYSDYCDWHDTCDCNE